MHSLPLIWRTIQSFISSNSKDMIKHSYVHMLFHPQIMHICLKRLHHGKVVLSYPSNHQSLRAAPPMKQLHYLTMTNNYFWWSSWINLGFIKPKWHLLSAHAMRYKYKYVYHMSHLTLSFYSHWTGTASSFRKGGAETKTVMVFLTTTIIWVWQLTWHILS